MANVEFSTGKSILVLSLVAACFAILWPKILYPMMTGAPSAKSPADKASGNIKQDRPPHLRPEIMGRGRAIPLSHIVPKVPMDNKDSPIKPPLPGMRPPMGGAGHVVPPPKTGGTMSVVMPLYTFGIVIFFMYTIMKVFVRKTSESELKDFQSEPEFRRVVFAEETVKPSPTTKQPRETSPTLIKAPSTETTRLGKKERDTIMTAIGGLLAEVDRQLEGSPGQYSEPGGLSAQPQEEEVATPGEESTVPTPAMEATADKVHVELDQVPNKEEEQEESVVPEEGPRPRVQQVPNKEESVVPEEGPRPRVQQVPSKEEEQEESVVPEEGPRVRVVNVTTRARAEGGGEWRPPPSPTLGLTHSRPTTPLPPPSPEPHNIFLEGSLPHHSQLLVEDSATELLDDENPAVILSGKMTLSLITVDDLPALVPIPEITDPESTLLDIESAVIEDESADSDAEGGQIEEVTHYTTANTAANPSVGNAEHAASGRQGEDLELDDTAADVSAHDLLDDQEELQEEYDAIWGALEMEEDGSHKDPLSKKDE